MKTIREITEEIMKVLRENEESVDAPLLINEFETVVDFHFQMLTGTDLRSILKIIDSDYFGLHITSIKPGFCFSVFKR